jgi:hypothetical protein
VLQPILRFCPSNVAGSEIDGTDEVSPVVGEPTSPAADLWGLGGEWLIGREREETAIAFSFWRVNPIRLPLPSASYGESGILTYTLDADCAVVTVLVG